MTFYENLMGLMATTLKSDQVQEFAGVEVQMRASDGYINLSSLASACGARFPNYLHLKKTQEFLVALEKQFQTLENQSLKPVQQCGTNHGINYWGHVLVAVDFCSWASPTLKIQFLSWILVLLSKGSVSLDTSASVADVQALVDQEVADLRTRLDISTMELEQRNIVISSLTEEVKSLEASINKYKLRRQRPTLPPGSGIYVGYTTASEDRCMLGKFDKDPAARHKAYHTHSVTPFKYGALLYTHNPGVVENLLLTTLGHLRPNSNEVVQLPYKRVVAMLQTFLTPLHAMGETEAYILTEDSSTLVSFNESVEDRSVENTLEDLDPPATTLHTTIVKKYSPKGRPLFCEPCNMTFEHARQASRHRAFWHDPDTEKCDQCGYTGNKNTLKRHMRDHQSAACDLCGANFSSWRSFNRHMKRRHKSIDETQ